MKSNISECPLCAAKLKLTSLEVKIGRGRVICDACGGQFNVQQSEEFNQRETQQGEQEAPVSVDPLDNDDLLIYDDMPLSDVGEADDHNQDINENPTRPSDQVFSPPVVGLFEEPELVDIERPKAKVSKWLLIPIITLLVLLALQYAHFNSATLAEDSKIEPYIVRLCGITACKVFRRDIDLMAVSNVDVVSHPVQYGVLVVRGKLSNNAGFRQPLPRLYVGFESIQGEAVASRLFESKEFLPKAVFSKGFLPKGDSVLFQFDLVDPGESAQSYSFDLQW